MGYCTTHELVTKNPDDHQKIGSSLKIMSGYEYSLFEESLKWYDCEKDCLAVSRSFPEILFAITGEGEEQCDIWRKTFYGGELIEDYKMPPHEFPPLPEVPKVDEKAGKMTEQNQAEKLANKTVNWWLDASRYTITEDLEQDLKKRVAETINLATAENARLLVQYKMAARSNELRDSELVLAISQRDQAQAQVADMEFKLLQCFNLKPSNWQEAICEVTKTQSALIQAEAHDERVRQEAREAAIGECIRLINKNTHSDEFGTHFDFEPEDLIENLQALLQQPVGTATASVKPSFTRDQIAKMSMVEFLKNEAAINDWFRREASQALVSGKLDKSRDEILWNILLKATEMSFYAKISSNTNETHDYVIRFDDLKSLLIEKGE